jgi:PKD repeat protein
MKNLLVAILSTAGFMTAASFSNAQVQEHAEGVYDYVDGKKYEKCGAERHEQWMLQNYPDYAANHQAEKAEMNQRAQEYTDAHYNERGGNVYVIPVVFHVAHVNGVENITDDQVHDAVAIMNRDYRMLNSDIAAVVTDFQGITADAEIEFRLAQKDQLGNCVSGITRTYTTATFDGDNGMVNDINRNINGNNSSANTRYPRHSYLNIWVCSNAGGAAGYTMTPSNWTPSKYDGIWVTHSYVGAIGTSNSSRSRTLTHEVGHWLNLSHCWGSTNDPGLSGNCSSDDNVSDTPNTEGWTSCTLGGTTCDGNLDNVQNYMEYSYCSKMFTEGQKSRMRSAITSSTGQRNQLWTTTNLQETGTDGPNNLCEADFSGNHLFLCAGDSVIYNDLSFHGATGWDWTFAGGTPATSSDENPTVKYLTGGTHDVTLSVTDGSSSVATTKTGYITVLPDNAMSTPLVEGFENVSSLPTAEWYIDNPDGEEGWELSTSVGYPGTGDNSIFLNNASNDAGQVDEFSSSTMDMSNMTAITMNFKVAFAQKNTSHNDKLIVYVSNTCGTTWSQRKQLSGASLATHTPTGGIWAPTSASDWMQVDVTSIPATYLVDNFRVKFRFESDDGNNIYIDDINISGTVGIEDEEANQFGLNIYPNPVEYTSTISFNLDKAKNVRVSVNDLLGREVLRLAEEKMPMGEQNVQLNNSSLNSGIYFVRLMIGDAEVTKKIVVR